VGSRGVAADGDAEGVELPGAAAVVGDGIGLGDALREGLGLDGAGLLGPALGEGAALLVLSPAPGRSLSSRLGPMPGRKGSREGEAAVDES